MKSPLVFLLLVSSTAHAVVALTPYYVEPPHVAPLLKLSYRRFSISNLNGSALWLDGAQLDIYALSRRWVRLGFEIEGGGANTELNSQTRASLGYGLFGLGLGFQYPWRVTPFLDGRFTGGILGGHLEGTSALAGQSAVTFLYGGGLETGIEVYTWRRLYLSGAVGWMRNTWHGVDQSLLTIGRLPAGVVGRDLTADTFTFKIGLGI
jgi:hypothetical protein